MENSMRVMLIDDIALARERMRVYLEPYSDMRIVGECDSGQQASRELVRLRPDLVFLDVQLADMSGFDVLASLQPEQRPLVVFLTAHEEYAVRAFEVSAVDYLVKPVDRARFAQSVNRARTVLNRTMEGAAPLPNASPIYLSRLAIRDCGQTELVPVGEIDYIDVAGHYLCIHVNSKVHLMRGSLRDLEKLLDPTDFLRTHRSKIVRLDRIRYLRPRHNGDYEVELHDGTVITLSRNYSPALLERLASPPPGV